MTRRLALSAGAVLLVAVFGLLLATGNRGPDPPLPANIDELDPDVAKLVMDHATAVREERSDLERWVLLGKVYEANALHGLAAESYKHVLDRDVDQAQTWFRYAICAEREGDLDEAIAAMERAIEFAPEFAAARWLQAMWLVNVGDTDKANQRADEAIALDADDPSSWFSKARVLLAQRDNQAAIDVIRSHHLERDTNGSYASYLLGTAFRQAGDLDQAAPYLAVSRNFRPTWHDKWSAELSEYHTGLSKKRSVASNMVKARQFEEATPLLEQIVAADPTDPRSLNLLGVSLMETGRFEQSLDAFERSIAANPSHFNSHLNYASAVVAAAAVGQGNVEKGLQRAETAISLRPDTADAHAVRGRLLVISGRLEPAIASFDRAFELDARAPTRAIEAALVEFRLGREEEAEERLENLLDSHSQHASVYVNLAAFKLNRGDLGVARSLAEQAQTVEITTNYYRQKAAAIIVTTKRDAEPDSSNQSNP